MDYTASTNNFEESSDSEAVESGIDLQQILEAEVKLFQITNPDRQVCITIPNFMELWIENNL